MLALTLIQPWATAIMTLGKDVENRPWSPSPKQLRPGRRFAIHAGAKLDRDIAGMLDVEFDADYDALVAAPRGALLGTVELVGFFGRVVPPELAGYERSRWRDSDERYGWALREPRLLPAPIPCKGALGLWRVPSEHVAALEAL